VDELTTLVADLDELIEKDFTAQRVLADHCPRFPDRNVADYCSIADFPAVRIDEGIAAIAEMEKIEGQIMS
jgi:hypothetical protein